jgi:hypothetical protein
MRIAHVVEVLSVWLNSTKPDVSALLVSRAIPWLLASM